MLNTPIMSNDNKSKNSGAKQPKNGDKNGSSGRHADNNNGRNERRSRTQYHYVYGSIVPENVIKNNHDDDDEDEDDYDSNLLIMDDRSIDAAPTSDQDSLIGESLIPTDNEDDGMVGSLDSESDFQHLLMTNGSRTTSLQKLTLLPTNNARRRTLKKSSPSSKHTNHHLHHHRRSTEPAWYIPLSLHHSHPFLFGLLLVVTGFLVTGLLAVIFFPDSAVAKAASRAATGQDLPYPVPWPMVKRANYNDAVETFLRMELFDQSFIENDKGSTFSFPFPTGAFWTNLVMKEAGATNGLSYPVVVYPYAYKWSNEMLQLSYPRQHRRLTATDLQDDFVPDLSLSTIQPTNRRFIQSFDPLSVTLRYEMDNKGSFMAYLVQGSPYWTVQFNNVAPVLTALTNFATVTCPKDADLAALGVTDGDEDNGDRRRRLRYGVCTEKTGGDDSQEKTLQGVQFILQSQEGVVWYVFASEPLKWTFNMASRRTLTSAHDFTGVLRVAMVPTSTLPPLGSSGSASSSSSSSSSQTLDSADSYLKSTGLARLIYHAGVYPTGASVEWSYSSTSSNGATEAVHIASKTVTGLAASMSGGGIPVGSNSTNSSKNQNNTTKSSSSSGATVSLTDRVATLTFKYSTQSFTQGSSAAPQKKLLMLALPHHARSLPSSKLLNKDTFDLVFECIKGALKPVLGSTWSYDIALPTFGLDGGQGSSDNIDAILDDASVRNTLLANLDLDVRLALPTSAGNIYGFGKESARLAQLLHVGTRLKNSASGGRADGNNDDDNNNNNKNSTSTSTGWTKSQSRALKSILKNAHNSLRHALEIFLSRNVSDTLVFDGDLGGLVSADGLWDPQADFGNGRYNDHHFHYGYILYACAIMASLDNGFLKRYSKTVDAIMYDVAFEGNFLSTHKRTSGPFFPGARHKSWFDGHSFASGLFPAANGKSQESSSEAVNCYYGAYLWSLARNGALNNPGQDTSSQTDFTRLLLATELTGAKTYWQMLPPLSTVSMTSSRTNKTTSTGSASLPQLPQQGVYNSQFAGNLMVGNVGMLDAVCRTWFGAQLLYVHMINFLPVTSVTGELFTQIYAKIEYETILNSLEAEPAWIGYLIANHAISDPNAAWADALNISSPKLDPGISKTQLLYWIASRKGFSFGNSTSTRTNPPCFPTSGSNSSSLGEALEPASATGTCTTNQKCANLGLRGACCPTPSGNFLDCCDS